MVEITLQDTAIVKMTQVLQRIAIRCRVIHQGYPDRTTCLDLRKMMRANPEKYLACYVEQILHDDYPCDACRAREVLEECGLVL